MKDKISIILYGLNINKDKSSSISNANSSKKRIAARVRHNPSSNQVHRQEARFMLVHFLFSLFGRREGERWRSVTSTDWDLGAL